MANYQEVELKVHVPDLDVVKQRLEAAGAELKAPRVYERNVRYQDEYGRFAREGITLRLREDTRVRLTYKDDGKSAGSGGMVSRFEAEVEVSDFDAMETILARLGFYRYMTYEKYRTTYELNGVEVVLDEMPYGLFVEMEGSEDAIPGVQQTLGLEDAARYRGGYSSLFERVRRHLGLRFNDLTFDNFRGIDVPESAFRE